MNFVLTVLSGLVVAFLVWIFGWTGTSTIRTVTRGSQAKRIGKWMMLISATVILGGLAWANTDKLIGYTIAGYGLLFFLAGKLVAWFQRN